MNTKQTKEILNNHLCIIVDTREQQNLNILKWFQNNNIQTETRKLDFGDYSVQIMPNDILQNKSAISFETSLCIEKKKDLTELSGNFFHNRTRFENELNRAKDAKFYLMIEQSSYLDLFKGNYRTQVHNNSFVATFFAFIAKYNIMPIFLDAKNNKQLAGHYIFNLLKYEIRNFLKTHEIKKN